jgi:DNA-binding MarR family transcriptional regulator
MPISETLLKVLDVDRTIHEPVRLLIMTYLSQVDSADFLFLLRELSLTYGNLSQHMSKLEAAGYVAVEKTIVHKRPRTTYRLTEQGRHTFQEYRYALTQFIAAVPG